MHYGKEDFHAIQSDDICVARSEWDSVRNIGCCIGGPTRTVPWIFHYGAITGRCKRLELHTDC